MPPSTGTKRTAERSGITRSADPRSATSTVVETASDAQPAARAASSPPGRPRPPGSGSGRPPAARAAARKGSGARLAVLDVARRSPGPSGGTSPRQARSGRAPAASGAGGRDRAAGRRPARPAPRRAPGITSDLVDVGQLELVDPRQGALVPVVRQHGCHHPGRGHAVVAAQVLRARSRARPPTSAHARQHRRRRVDQRPVHVEDHGVEDPVGERAKIGHGNFLPSR